MAQVTETSLKRSSSSLSSLHEPHLKGQKRPYHHHHKLQQRVQTDLQEPAIPDDATITHLLNRSIGQVLASTGYEIAEPTALDAFRQATEEYILHLASFVRQSMISSRRMQPIPQDFEYAFQRAFISTDELLPQIKTEPYEPIPTLLPSPPPEDKDPFDAFLSIPILGDELSGERDRLQSGFIPAHFPQFPSIHTYRFTPVYTDRETDPQRIRELGTEDGRHGEEALRKLARAAFKDTHVAGVGKGEKRLWGRKSETMESMFEKTIRGLTKKYQPDGKSLDTDGSTQKPARFSMANIELAPIVNCERDFWRKVATGSPKTEKPVDIKDPVIAKVERWVSS
ncbi:bromodomain associated domain protein [Talaromyces proteolyticus]|uniref:Transcription initiation factor TFIID subunit 8 n=1 Tax=Talaromyces proteolyticus TaxID=1131652 RepID=A0AAD4PY47_9EURO|nr:bromodomain associated domain protein [Talaromyces proteolyticus]KAH8694240.1 bromodomain associated domain protein [Talaromyces proteolyticus]